MGIPSPTTRIMVLHVAMSAARHMKRRGSLKRAEPLCALCALCETPRRWSAPCPRGDAGAESTEDHALVETMIEAGGGAAHPAGSEGWLPQDAVPSWLR
jgi:hypothetical protein